MLLGEERENEVVNQRPPVCSFLKKSSDKHNYVEFFSDWCAASVFDWKFAYWSVNETLEIHPYKPENIDFFHPPIRVIPKYPALKFSAEAFNNLRLRLRSNLDFIFKELQVNVDTWSYAALLSLCILVADFSEEISFWLDTRSELADQVLEYCVRNVSTSFRLFNKLLGYTFD